MHLINGYRSIASRQLVNRSRYTEDAEPDFVVRTSLPYDLALQFLKVRIIYKERTGKNAPQRPVLYEWRAQSPEEAVCLADVSGDMAFLGRKLCPLSLHRVMRAGDSGQWKHILYIPFAREPRASAVCIPPHLLQAVLRRNYMYIACYASTSSERGVILRASQPVEGIVSRRILKVDSLKSYSVHSI